MTSNLTFEKQDMSASQLLNIYISTAGKKVTYDDVNRAVQKEKRAQKIREFRKKYKFLFPLVLVFFVISSLSEDFSH